MFWGNTKYSKWFPTQFNLLVNCISNVLKNDARASHLIDPKCIALKLSNTTNDSLLFHYFCASLCSFSVNLTSVRSHNNIFISCINITLLRWYCIWYMVMVYI
eukprot:219186_1